VIWVKLQALHCVRLGSFGGGVFHNYCSILNLKFESSAIHTYCLYFVLAVRNAIDDSGFLDQVIGIELSNLGHCFHLMGHLRWPKRDRERGKETEKEKRDRERERARGKR